MKVKKIKGKHFVFDLYGCDYHETNSPKELEKLLVGAAKAAKMEILHTYFHHFSPHGVTGVLVLSTSHISVHTWPEYGYAAFDVFSCSDEVQTRKAMNHITRELIHNRKKIHEIDRGYAELKTIDIPVYKNNSKKRFTVHKKLAEIKNSYQKIQVLDVEQFGATLFIDGVTQVSEFDHHIYDSAILKPMRKNDSRILILGGGDGFVAREVLKKNPRAHVTIVELDPDVVYAARTYFSQGEIFDDPRVTLVVADARKYLSDMAASEYMFDGVVIDLTDVPVGSNRAAKRVSQFYKSLLHKTKEFLAEDGWISVQAGAAKTKRPHVNLGTVVYPYLKDSFKTVEKNTVYIPSFLEDSLFLYATSAKVK